MGGVAIFKNDLTEITTTTIDVSNFCSHFTCEAAMISVKHNSQHFYLLGIYRTPGRSAVPSIEAVSGILNLAQTQSKSIVVMGDINIDRLNTDHLDTRMLEEELLTHNIKRLPLPATRITSTTATSIDCICTNLKEDEIEFSVFETGLSDHTAQTLVLKNISETKLPLLSIYKRNYSQLNLDKIKKILQNDDWTDIYSCIDLDTSYEFSK